ncbi:MAG: FKBP-type peptidyl-prolyl cis-trans isomerase [Balneolaceae bacterium]|nr:FKBP-type peptidyl-prolyl cis-trans isomerase [Balneolaceae bacterium]
MHKSLFSAVVVISVLFLVFVSCGTEDDFFGPPDFSTVPEPYNTGGVEPVSPEEGVEVYILEEGTGPFYLTSRDEVMLFLTLRTNEGEIIYSTFANGFENPVPVLMRNSGNYQNTFRQDVIQFAYTPGLRIGLLGMKEGEKRSVIVSPEKGYGNVPSGSPNAAYRESTLIYDIRVSTIGP